MKMSSIKIPIRKSLNTLSFLKRKELATAESNSESQKGIPAP